MSTKEPTTMTGAESLVKLGRKRDHTRDQEILDAALEVLAETGYEGMTIDMVAARAKAGKATVYRRWSSKTELVLDAVACMKKGERDNSTLPDTGTLRGDLVAMIRPRRVDDEQKRIHIMTGVVSMLTRDPELARVVKEAIIEPHAEVGRILLNRAIARGEIPADVDVETLATLIPSLTIYRTMLVHKPMDRQSLLSVIDGILLPAVGLGRGGNANAMPGD